MHLLISNTLDPYLNIATEEFLLKNYSEDILFLYRNASSVIVGKHQNAMAEVNYRFIQENNIPLIRRISGGGTVYHDEGNVNFTFIQNGEEGRLVNFKAFITPVAEFLKQLGAAAEIGVRNDILINNLKVSGNAEHIYKKRTLHHGTLLFSSTLTDLRNALHAEPGKYADKAVKSVRSKVTNIKDNISRDLTVDQFVEQLSEYLKNHYTSIPLSLSENDYSQIRTSANQKYKDWHWNFGYSPNYTFANTIELSPYTISIQLQVERGIIKSAIITGNVQKQILSEIGDSLLDQPHSASSLSTNKSINKLDSMFTTGSSEILWSFF